MGDINDHGSGLPLMSQGSNSSAVASAAATGPRMSPTSGPAQPQHAFNSSASGSLAHAMMMPSLSHIIGHNNNQQQQQHEEQDVSVQLETSTEDDDRAYFAQAEMLNLELNMDSFFMQCASAEARTTPYNIQQNYHGCVIADVDNNTIIVSSRSNQHGKQMHAIQGALSQLDKLSVSPLMRSRLTVFATCEPCVSCCAPLLQQSSIKRLCIAALEPKSHEALQLLHRDGTTIKFLCEHANSVDIDAYEDLDSACNNYSNNSSNDSNSHNNNNNRHEDSEYEDAGYNHAVNDALDDDVIVSAVDGHEHHISSMNSSNSSNSNGNTHVSYLEQLIYRSQQARAEAIAAGNDQSDEEANSDDDDDDCNVYIDDGNSNSDDDNNNSNSDDDNGLDSDGDSLTTIEEDHIANVTSRNSPLIKAS